MFGWLSGSLCWLERNVSVLKSIQHSTKIDGLLKAWRWLRCIPSEHREPIIQRPNFTNQNTRTDITRRCL